MRVTDSRIQGFDRLFCRYLTWLVRRSFGAVWVTKSSSTLPDGGYIAVANHTSWWDGFIPAIVHKMCLPKSNFSIMMSQAELRRFPFFRWGGAFAVDAASARRAKAAIEYAADEAARGSGVWIFPQGQIMNEWSGMRFTSGFAHAARLSSRPIVPVAMRFVMRAGQRPEAFINIGRPQGWHGRQTVWETEDAVRRLLSEIAVSIQENVVSRTHRLLFVPSAGVDDRVSSLFARFKQ
jgi:1-acyl-sn-glycerol-3-phosphate acyltransferase